MNYAEEMLARQAALWRSICASFPMKTEDETQQAAKKQRAFEEELRAMQREWDVDPAREGGFSRDTSAFGEIARRAVRAVMDEVLHETGKYDLSAAERVRSLIARGADEMLRGETLRAVDAPEANALMRALSKESAQRSARILPSRAEETVRGVRAVTFGETAAEEGAAHFASVQGEAAHLYGAPLAAAQELHAQIVAAQEVSRRFERDSRRYDTAFIRYE